MVIKADVTPEQKARIKELAAAEGKSVSSYIKEKVLCWTDPSAASEPLLKLIEAQAPVLQRMTEVATTVIQNKVIYEAEILELLDRMAWIEDVTAATVKEVLHNGNSGQQERQGNPNGSRKV